MAFQHRYLFTQGNGNRSIQTRQEIINPPTAAYRVLNLPELLEEIVLYDLSTISTTRSRSQPRHWNNGWIRLNNLRRVSKRWSLVINCSPKLGKIIFRYPAICSYVKIEKLRLCEPFLCSLGKKMRHMSEIKNYRGASTLTQFEEFRDKIAPLAGYTASGVFVSRPAVEAVYIRFSGLADTFWLGGYEAFVRPVDYSRVSSSHDYCYHHKVINRRGGGVTAEDLVSSLLLVLCKFLSFEGEFRNLTIDLAVGNCMSLDNTQLLSIVSSRPLWEPVWSARGKPQSPTHHEEERLGMGFDILRRISGVFSRIRTLDHI